MHLKFKNKALENLTWVKVVLCLLLAGVGHELEMWFPCWGNDEITLPGDERPADTGVVLELGSGLSFLNAPSEKKIRKIHSWKKYASAHFY